MDEPKDINEALRGDDARKVAADMGPAEKKFLGLLGVKAGPDGFDASSAKFKSLSKNIDERERRIIVRVQGVIEAAYWILIVGMSALLVWAGLYSDEMPFFYLFVGWLFLWMVINIFRTGAMLLLLPLILFFARSGASQGQ